MNTYAHAVVRGENARKEYQLLKDTFREVLIQKHMKQKIGWRMLNDHDQHRAVIHLQSGTAFVVCV